MSHGKVVEIKSVADFEKQLSEAGDKCVIVDFKAVWCGPCKMISPHFHELSSKYSGVFLQVDVDEVADLAQKYSIEAMPTFLFLKNGAKVEDVVGANKVKLTETVAKYCPAL